MEIPRYWREMPTNVRFGGREKVTKILETTSFKFPGGEIPLVGNLETIRERFAKRGFNSETTEEILTGLFATITSKTAIPTGEVLDNLFELIGSEIGK